MNVKKYEEWCGYYDPKELELELLKNKISFNNKGVLDIGCGTGRLSFRIIPYVKKLIGIDIEKKAIDICNKKKQKSPYSHKAKFSVLDANHINLPGLYFDVVMFSWSIYLISDKEKVLYSVRRILKNDGYVAALQPIGGDYEEILFHFYEKDNLSKFVAHSSESLDLLNKIFGNCIEDTLETYFVFPNIEKAIEMTEFFVEDEDFRSLSDKERKSLRNKLMNHENNAGEIVLSDIVKLMISKKVGEVKIHVSK